MRCICIAFGNEASTTSSFCALVTMATRAPSALAALPEYDNVSAAFQVTAGDQTRDILQCCQSFATPSDQGSKIAALNFKRPVLRLVVLRFSTACNDSGVHLEKA